MGCVAILKRRLRWAFWCPLPFSDTAAGTGTKRQTLKSKLDPFLVTSVPMKYIKGALAVTGFLTTRSSDDNCSLTRDPLKGSLEGSYTVS